MHKFKIGDLLVRQLRGYDHIPVFVVVDKCDSTDQYRLFVIAHSKVANYSRAWIEMLYGSV